MTKTENAPVKLLRAHMHPPELPIPSNIRQRERMDYWRDRIWRVRNKWFVLLGPQYRELVRKICFSCDRAGLPEMISHLRVGLCFLWFMTGNIRIMEDFVVAVFNGRVFLMNHRSFFSDNELPHVPLLLGTLNLLLGLFVILAHNVWTWGIPVIVTLAGWIMTLKSIVYLLFPSALARVMPTDVGMQRAFRLFFYSTDAS